MITYFGKCATIDPADHLKTETNQGGIFFDRDGTIIVEKNYLKDREELEILPGVIPALQRLRRTGLPIYIFTNQAGVAHGYFSEETLNRIHFYLAADLKDRGIQLRGIYYCPHHPQAEVADYRYDCYCRKPKPGLLRIIAARDGLDLNHSYVIGDKIIDLAAGKSVGAKTALVLTGYGPAELGKISPLVSPDFVGTDLTAIADWIIADRNSLKPYQTKSTDC